MRRLKNTIRNYFTFTRNERIGLYILIALIILFGLVNQFVFYYEKPGEVEVSEFKKLIEKFQLGKQNEKKQMAVNKTLFSFNPNLIDSLSLDSLQLPNQVKNNLLKYRSKNGKFRYKEDLKKLYGINDSIYFAIEGYIELASRPKIKSKVCKSKKILVPKKNEPEKVLIEKRKLEVNKATVAELKSVYGIGDVLSRRIIKYRNLLGGFNSVDQLQEVYGLSEENFQQIKEQVTIDASLVKKIDVNFANETELVKHPYLNWKEVNAILSYRNKKGFIDCPNVFLEDKVLNDSVYHRIMPYLRTK